MPKRRRVKCTWHPWQADLVLDTLQDALAKPGAKLDAVLSIHAEVNGMSQDSDTKSHAVLADALNVAKALVGVLDQGGRDYELELYASCALQELSIAHRGVHAVAEAGAAVCCVALLLDAGVGAYTLFFAERVAMDSQLPDGGTRSYYAEVLRAGALAPLVALLQREDIDIAKAAADALRVLTKEARAHNDMPRVDVIMDAFHVPVPEHLPLLREMMQRAAEESRAAREALFGGLDRPTHARLQQSFGRLSEAIEDAAPRLPEQQYLELCNASKDCFNASYGEY